MMKRNDIHSVGPGGGWRRMSLTRAYIHSCLVERQKYLNNNLFQPPLRETLTEPKEVFHRLHREMTFIHRLQLERTSLLVSSRCASCSDSITYRTHSSKSPSPPCVTQSSGGGVAFSAATAIPQVCVVYHLKTSSYRNETTIEIFYHSVLYFPPFF